jgi:hypothetical protein
MKPRINSSCRTKLQHQQLNNAMSSSSSLNARQGKQWNTMFLIMVGFALAQSFNFFFYTETATVDSMISFNSNNNNNNHQQQQQQQQQQPWASLSSTFPPPRAPPPHRTLEKEMAALGNWQMQTIASVSKGKFNPFQPAVFFEQQDTGRKVFGHE